MALTLKLPLAALLAIVALVGIGTSGTQMLIYVANYFPMRVRGAVVWFAGFGSEASAGP
jgi:AAHS family benzoate transporter-like MFS transporter